MSREMINDANSAKTSVLRTVKHQLTLLVVEKYRSEIMYVFM
jgi:hypothetical protein